MYLYEKEEMDHRSPTYPTYSIAIFYPLSNPSQRTGFSATCPFGGEELAMTNDRAIF